MAESRQSPPTPPTSRHPAFRSASYITALAVFIYLLVANTAPLAQRCLQNARCARRLVPSLFAAFKPDLQVDIADHQWRAFRERMPLLVVVAMIHSTAGALVRRRLRSHRACIAYDAVAGLGLVVFIHRAQSVHLLVLAALHYALGRACRARAFVQLLQRAHIGDSSDGGDAAKALSWLLMLCVLVLRHYGRQPLKYHALLGQRFIWLDRDSPYAGMGWWDHANLMALRMHSFVADESRALAGGGERRGWLAYLSYIFYAPLYVAGPVMGAQDFFVQQERLAGSIAIRGGAAAFAASSGGSGGSGGGGDGGRLDIAVYAFKWMACLILMEWLSSRAPCFALAHAGGLLASGATPSTAPEGDMGRYPEGANAGTSEALGTWTAGEALVFSYMSLNLIWIKFLLIWRLFRLWARLDGREPPENLPRGLQPPLSILGFWRGWHASFYQWLVAYVYIPLGGRRHRWRNVVIVFAFVGLWHGVEPRMLGWALLMGLVLAPEVAAEHFHATWPGVRLRWYYPHVAAAGGATSICALILANLVGFGAGALEEVLANLQAMMRLLLFSREGVAAASGAWMLVFVHVLVHLKADLESRRSELKGRERVS